MGRSRYRIHDKNAPHFLTCTVLNWLPLFTRPETACGERSGVAAEAGYIHRNPVKPGYVDDPLHWRYSSARNYAGLPGLMPVFTGWL